MYVQLTNAGAALLQGNTGPVTITGYQLGSAYNYIPQPTDTAIHGTEVFSGVPSAPVPTNANVVKYSVYLDYDTGPFSFGEVGLYVGSTLFALAASNLLIQKLQLTSTIPGNSIRIDIYLSMVGSNYEMWLDLAESNNQFHVAVLGSVDYLPPPQNATPNMYIVSGATTYQPAFTAYTDQRGLWAFDAYEYAGSSTATVVASDSLSVTIASTDYTANLSPSFLGDVVVEFTTGALYGVCRYVSSAVISGSQVTLAFDNPLMILPAVGDKFVGFSLRASAVAPSPVSYVLPVATASTLGGVKAPTTGNLVISQTGVIDIGFTVVSSVAGKTGAVALVYSDISGLSTVAHSGSYTDLLNKPALGSTTLAGLTDVTVGTPADAESLSYSTAAGKWVSNNSPYDVVGFYPDIPPNSAMMWRFIIPRIVVFPANLVGSYATAEAAATAATTLTITQNGTAIGTVNFAAGATTGTFTFASAVTTAAGDIIRIVNQATADTTLGNISITLVGRR